MGWYTFVDGGMVFYKETWQHKEEVQDRIDDNKKDIEDVKLEIAMLAAGRVEDLIQTKDCEGNDIDVPMAIRWKLEDLWERLEDAQYENWKLEFLLENWDKRHGTFIDNPLIPDNSVYTGTDKEQEQFIKDHTKYQPPIEPDDSNPLIVTTQEPAVDSNPRQLKLEFDDTSAKESPTTPTYSDHSAHSVLISHNLGSLNDLKL
jgi:hypothetical protein